jgi:hypothetical protein
MKFWISAQEESSMKSGTSTGLFMILPANHLRQSSGNKNISPGSLIKQGFPGNFYVV